MDPVVGVSTLVALLEKRAREDGDRLAFRSLSDAAAPRDVSYAQLSAEVERVALLLTARLHVGDAVVLLFNDSLAYLTGLLACARAGMLAVSGMPPFPPRMTRNSLRDEQRARRALAIFEQSNAHAALGTSDLLEAFSRAMSRDHSRDIQWIADDGMSPEGAWPTLAEVASDDLAMIQYSSGSTDMPSGVALSHANLMANLKAHAAALALNEQDIGVSWLPFFHDLGLIGTGLLPIYAKFPCILLPSTRFAENPLHWLEAISAAKATISWGPNFAYQQCVRRIASEDRLGLDLSSWSVAMNAAEPVSVRTIDDFASAFAVSGFRRSAMLPCYGLAEATLAVSLSTRGQGPRIATLARSALDSGVARDATSDDAPGDAVDIVSCGHPADDVGVAIVDPGTKQRRAPGIVGEIWLSGPGVGQGCYRRPEITDAAYRAYTEVGEGPFLRTGDLGFERDGELFVTGRLKDLIIVHGINIQPHDLERIAETCHPAIREHCGAAFSVSGPDEESIVVVFEVSRSGERDAANVALAIRRAIFEEAQLHVRTVVILRAGSVFKTPSGKVQRRLLRQTFLAAELAPLWIDVAPIADEGGATQTTRSAEVATEADVERWIMGILGIRPLTAGRSSELQLADLGADSLRVTQLSAAIHARFGILQSPGELFEQGSVQRICRFIAQALSGQSAAAAEPGPRRAEAALALRRGRRLLQSRWRARIPEG